jgi:hypothetical protein
VKVRRITPLGAVVGGMLAGAAGTAAMDAVRYARYRSGGGSEAPLRWELGGVRGWQDATPPGQVGRRVAEGFLQRPLPETAAQPTNNAVHWGYGAAWGAMYGVLSGSMRRSRILLGPFFGTAVWLAGYATLGAAGLYRPIWRYGPKTLAGDWAAHAVYGTTVALAFKLFK